MFLLIAVALTIIATIIQQISSSDSPYKATITIDSVIYNIELPVFHAGKEECPIQFNLPDISVSGKLFYKSLRGKDYWKFSNLSRTSMTENLVMALPSQKANTKIMYYIEFYSKGKTYNIAKETPVIIRFQETVPKYLQYPQVILMFVSLIFACFAGFLTISHVDSYKKYAKLTFYCLAAGALVLGLIMHLVAFRHLFLQIMPYNDLLFYKNLIIFLIWWGVYSFNKKHEIQYLTLAATVVTLVLYCLPQHFIFGWIGRLVY